MADGVHQYVGGRVQETTTRPEGHRFFSTCIYSATLPSTLHLELPSARASQAQFRTSQNTTTKRRNCNQVRFEKGCETARSSIYKRIHKKLHSESSGGLSGF